jgi:carboxypeptidase Q
MPLPNRLPRSIPFALRRLAGAGLAATLLASPAAAQSFPAEEPVLRRIWQLGMDSSQVMALSQVLLDSIGPRLTGTPGIEAAQRWLIGTYGRWGIQARNERYGTWRGWRRGPTHVDMVAPWVRSLEAIALSWSPPGRGEGEVVILPELADSAAYARWLPSVRGKYVLTSMPQASCRTDANIREHGTPATVARVQRERDEARTSWTARTQRAGGARELPLILERAGALGIVTMSWATGWAAERIFGARTERAPTISLGCEDYGMLARLAERNQGPRIRVSVEAQALGEVPVHNTIGEIRGTEKPDEYVMLSAHLDSWQGAPGATDNGSGTAVMLEAMRILKAAYPRPKRTILVGHWSGEEQGLNGSRAWALDNAAKLPKIQALFNNDNGTGRIQGIGMQGFTGAGESFARWLAAMPSELTSDIRLQIPGNPGFGGTDNASFVCHGVPAFELGGKDWDYFSYTWHTDLDTWDKLVAEDLRANATLVAMLAYLASEDPQRVSREQRAIVTGGFRAQAGARNWPTCTAPARSSGESTR